jgi:peptidoglycan/LPS O-acetylase OafA/YrhL
VRNSTLDVLRAVAILLVFGRHSAGLPFFGRFGWAGVDLFFVLSGFLVSGLLFREYQQRQAIQAGRFLIRRGFKIYPQFYFLIAITVAGMLVAGIPIHLKALGAEVAFFQNYTAGLWDYTWSLAVEEHFYLLLAIVLTGVARRGGDDPFHALPKWIAGIGAVCVLLRVATWRLNPETSLYIHIAPSHLRMDSLLAGVLLSYLRCFRADRLAAFALRFGEWIPPASIALLAPLSFLNQEDPFIYTIGFSMVSVGFTLLLMSALYPVRLRKPGIVSRALAGLGRISYAFYLWHAPVIFMTSRLGLPHFGAIAVSFAVTLAIAWLTTWALENPMLRLRDRWFPSPRVSREMALVAAPAG